MDLSALKERLLALGIRPDAYSVGAGLPQAHETYCIVAENSVWRVYYAECGNRVDMREFETEEAACNAFFDLVMSDRSVWLP